MSLYQYIESAASKWMNDEGPDSDIVVSSRIRIARNLKEYIFPKRAIYEQSKQVQRDILGASRELEPDFGNFEWFVMNQLNELEKQVLVEKRLISHDLAYESKNGAVILSENEAISIMANEEDHLRIQCLFPGLQLQEAWDLAGKIDDVFESQFEYAFDEKFGYLTSCPTNVGTGIRASVMLHLPALVITEQINRTFFAINQVGLVVRGIYGENSEILGNHFQISNQITLGQSEEEIINNLYGVVKQIIDQERAARARLMHESGRNVVNQISRSFGVLSYATLIDTKEAAQRLSDVRLGIDLNIVKGIRTSTIHELMVMMQPAFLQQLAGHDLSAEDRDAHRANIIRQKLSERDMEVED